MRRNNNKTTPRRYQSQCQDNNISSSIFHHADPRDCKVECDEKLTILWKRIFGVYCTHSIKSRSWIFFNATQYMAQQFISLTYWSQGSGSEPPPVLLTRVLDPSPKSIFIITVNIFFYVLSVFLPILLPPLLFCHYFFSYSSIRRQQTRKV